MYNIHQAKKKQAERDRDERRAKTARSHKSTKKHQRNVLASGYYNRLEKWMRVQIQEGETKLQHSGYYPPPDIKKLSMGEHIYQHEFAHKRHVQKELGPPNMSSRRYSPRQIPQSARKSRLNEYKSSSGLARTRQRHKEINPPLSLSRAQYNGYSTMANSGWREPSQVFRSENRDQFVAGRFNSTFRPRPKVGVQPPLSARKARDTDPFLANKKYFEASLREQLFAKRVSDQRYSALVPSGRQVAPKWDHVNRTRRKEGLSPRSPGFNKSNKSYWKDVEDIALSSRPVWSQLSASLPDMLSDEDIDLNATSARPIAQPVDPTGLLTETQAGFSLGPGRDIGLGPGRDIGPGLGHGLGSSTPFNAVAFGATGDFQTPLKIPIHSEEGGIDTARRLLWMTTQRLPDARSPKRPQRGGGSQPFGNSPRKLYSPKTVPRPLLSPAMPG